MTFYYLSNGTIPSDRANSIQVMQMCQAFSRLVDDVTLLCRQGQQGPDNVHSYYGVDDSFRIRTISVPKLRVLDRLCLAVAALREIRNTEPRSIVYARDKFVAGILCVTAPADLQIVIEVHAPPINAFWRRWLRLMLATGRVSKIIAISEALAREYLRVLPGLAEDMILVAHDGASPTTQEGMSCNLGEVTDANPATRVGYVGSLRPGKGMEMIHQLASLLPDVEFHVVGGNYEAVQSWRAKATHPNVVFHGFVSPAAADSYIAQFDVVLAPYQPSVLVGNEDVDISRWMSPLKIFEYMKWGRPIIASDLPVLREVLVNGDNAVLANPTDPWDWKVKIVNLLAHSDLRSRIGDNARRDFLAKYTWDRRAELILAAIRAPRERRPLSETANL